MAQEHRGRQKPLPDNTYKRLNADQLLTLVLVEEFGWHMSFVRQPLSQNPIFVVFNNIIDHYAILNNDGSLSIESGIKTRDESPE